MVCAVGVSAMKQIAESPEREQMVTFMEQHDGHLRRYRYFTRPAITWMANNPQKHSVNEYKDNPFRR
jgi:hypothetical protein